MSSFLSSCPYTKSSSALTPRARIKNSLSSDAPAKRPTQAKLRRPRASLGSYRAASPRSGSGREAPSSRPGLHLEERSAHRTAAARVAEPMTRPWIAIFCDDAQSSGFIPVFMDPGSAWIPDQKGRPGTEPSIRDSSCPRKRHSLAGSVEYSLRPGAGASKRRRLRP